MALSKQRSGRKASSGRLRSHRGKRKFELHGYPSKTKIDDADKRKVQRTLGGGNKVRSLLANKINIATKEGVKSGQLKKVLENRANKHLVRRNILTKGCIVETSLGKVRITSRPGQTGSVDGILIK